MDHPSLASVCGRCRCTDNSPSTLLAASSAPSCSVCLGLLHLESLLPSITQSVTSANYEFSDFQLQLSLPSVLPLRQAWLQHRLPGAVELKDAVRVLLTPALEQALSRPHHSGSVLTIRVTATCSKADEDLALLRMPGKYKKEPNAKSIAQAVEHVDAALLSSYHPKPYTAVFRTEVSHQPLYVGGSYLKLSRQVSQSPWLIEGEDQPSLSVQQLVGAPLQQAFGCASYSLHASV